MSEPAHFDEAVVAEIAKEVGEEIGGGEHNPAYLTRLVMFRLLRDYGWTDPYQEPRDA